MAKSLRKSAFRPPLPSKGRLALKSLAAEGPVLYPIFDRAIQVIGDSKEAMRWMGTPVRSLGYATPISLLATIKGRDAVLAVLGRLEHGVL